MRKRNQIEHNQFDDIKGSISYEKDRNRWRVIYPIVDPITHQIKRYSKRFVTEQEAKDYLLTLQYQKNNPIFIKNNGIPLNELMHSNLQRKLDTGLISERQYVRVLNTIRLIEKWDGSRKNISNLTSDEIQDFFTSIKHYSNSYIKQIMSQFNQAYTLAANKGYIMKNPMVDVLKPKSDKPNKIVRALELEEQEIFTEDLMKCSLEEEPYKNVFLIQMYCGLRCGEVLALKSSDINLSKNLLYVNKTLTSDKNGKVIMGNTTKTYAGVREVPIPEFIMPSVQEQLLIAQNNKDHQLFMTENGNYVDVRNANRQLKKRLAALGIEGISTHSLRHTYGTRCVEAGMRAVALQRLMGHTDVSITLNTYTSVFNKFKEAELDKVNQYYIDNNLFKSIPSTKLIDNTSIDSLDEPDSPDELEQK